MRRRNKPGNGHLCLAGYWHPDGSHGVKNQFRIDDDITITIGRKAGGFAWRWFFTHRRKWRF